MNQHLPLFILMLSVFILASEIAFFVYCTRWIHRSKKERDAQFKTLDTERQKLAQLQATVRADLERCEHLTQDNMAKLTAIGAQAHAEWTEMMEKFTETSNAVSEKVKEFTDENLEALNRAKLGSERVLKDAELQKNALLEATQKASKVLRFFDKTVPADEIVKQLQTDKYAEAKRLLAHGIDATSVSKKLGLSLGEVSLLASMV